MKSKQPFKFIHCPSKRLHHKFTLKSPAVKQCILHTLIIWLKIPDGHRTCSPTRQKKTPLGTELSPATSQARASASYPNLASPEPSLNQRLLRGQVFSGLPAPSPDIVSVAAFVSQIAFYNLLQLASIAEQFSALIMQFSKQKLKLIWACFCSYDAFRF